MSMFLDDNPFELFQEEEEEWVPGTARYDKACTSTVEISISCKDLVNKDILSKTDSICIVYHKPIGCKYFIELVRTEIKNNTLCPEFSKKVLFEYHFEERQSLRFELYDVDISDNLSRLNFIGYIECTLAEIVSFGIKGYNRPLRQGFPVHVQIAREKKLASRRSSSWSCRWSRKNSINENKSPSPSPTPGSPVPGQDGPSVTWSKSKSVDHKLFKNRRHDLGDSKDEELSKKGFSFSLSRMGSLFDLSQEKPIGTICLIAEELACLKEEVTIQLGGQNLGHKSFFCIKPRIYFIISRRGKRPNTFIPVHVSDVVRSRNPHWDPFTMRLRRLCNGDQKVPLKIEFFQKSLGVDADKRLAYCQTCLAEMNMKIGSVGIPLIGEHSSGTMSMLVLLCKVSPFSTFIDYIQGGVQIHCCIAIDFTSSNGLPDDPTSLHYISKGKLNPYEQGIVAVGSVLQDYDSDKLFPVFGFGCHIPPFAHISHCFYATLSDSGFCYGVPGVLEAYKNCVPRVDFFGPTYFSNVINYVANLAKQADKVKEKDKSTGEEYFILLIITDGCINDMDRTKEAIIAASHLPLSIIVLGVGEEDFTKMEQLDGDSVRLSFKGKQAQRDIVQFVAFRDTLTWFQESTAKTVRGKLRLGSPDLIYDILKMQKEIEDSDEDVDGDDDETKKQKKARREKKKKEKEAEEQEQRDKKNLKPYKDDAVRKLAMKKLAKEVLAEIPEQFVSYMKYKGIKPRKPGVGGDQKDDEQDDQESMSSVSVASLRNKSPGKKQVRISKSPQHLSVPPRGSANSRRGT